MSIKNNIYVPNQPWLNPFDGDKEFDIKLDEDYTLTVYDKNKLFIYYEEFYQIRDFLNNDITNEIKQKIINGDLKLVFIDCDSNPIFDIDVLTIKENDWFFKNKNIQLWQTSYVDDNTLEQNLYVGLQIHYVLRSLINVDYTHSVNNFTKHFLTLNNKDKPDREELYNLYKTLDTDKFIASFNFKSVFLEKHLFNDDGSAVESTYDLNILNFYKQCLFEIVCESGHENVTEKTYKPLLLGVPFIPYSSNVNGQIGYFKHIGIDINYFDLDFNDIENVNEFIKKIVSMDVDTVRQTYKHVFVKAEENRTKIKNYFNYVKDKITNL